MATNKSGTAKSGRDGLPVNRAIILALLLTQKQFDRDRRFRNIRSRSAPAFHRGEYLPVCQGAPASGSANRRSPPNELPMSILCFSSELLFQAVSQRVARS